MFRFLRHREPASALAILCLLTTACSGSDSSNGLTAPTDFYSGAEPTSGTRPTTTPLPECPADVVDRRDDWPFVVAEVVDVTEYVVDGDEYTVRGVTNQPEAVLVETMEVAFGDYTADEPTGGANDIQATFTSERGTAELTMSDDDTNGCWDVVVTAAFVEGAVPAAESGPETNTPAREPPSTDPLNQAEAVGATQVITPRGTYRLSVTTCSFDPVDVQASGADGELTISADGDAIGVVWRYTDDVEIADDEATVIAMTVEGATIVADGEGPEGPETVFVEIVCSTPG